MGSSGIDHGERRGAGGQRRRGSGAAPDASGEEVTELRGSWRASRVGAPLVIEVELEHHVNVTVPQSSGPAVQTHRRRVVLVR